MIQIPKQLQQEKYRFCLVEPKGKSPRVGGKGWQHGLKYNDPKLLAHLKAGGNYGVIGGHGNLIILDIDNLKLAAELFKKLDTFTVQTCGNTYHFYFEVKDGE